MHHRGEELPHMLRPAFLVHAVHHDEEAREEEQELKVDLLELCFWFDAGDHHHHRHKHRKEYKEEYWDGHCKVERKWKKNGEYKEKRKCQDRPVYYAPQPVYSAPPPPVVVHRPARPEAIVISPQIVIRP